MSYVAGARPRGRVTGGGVEATVLVLALAALGVLFVPAHWVSIWMDPEFTGGMGPLANRLVDGERLYTDGMHSPLPPLTFVLLRIVGGGDVSWLTGSVLNYLFQALTLLASWLALRETFGRRIGFLAAVCAIPIFLALPKTVVYDSLVQLCVALAAWIVAARPARWPVLLGVVTAVAVLTKQSTGLGLAGGVVLALVLSGGPYDRRWLRDAALYAAGAVVAFGVLMAALAPWASPSGLVHDVLLTGSEPKGGAGEVAGKAAEWFVDVGGFALVCSAVVAAAVLADRRLGLRRRLAGVRDVSWWRSARRLDAPGAGAMRLSVAAVAGAALGAASWALDSARLSDPLMAGPARVDDEIRAHMHPAMLAAVVVLAIVAFWRARARGEAGDRRLLGVFGVVLLAALGHSLSSPGLRWTYDNNPLIPFALACLLVTAIWLVDLVAAARPRLHAAAGPACAFLLGAVCWASLGSNVRFLSRADTSWPEIAHLDGAKLRPESSGMRRLVARVRTLAGPGEPVLLLPEDPNVQEWFERPRPRMTSAMVFVDQYWDRYVEEDFDRLAADPPKVIVIGPRGFWRFFHHVVQAGAGAERLVDRVRRELLPRRFVRRPAVRIDFRGSSDWMDVWVRR